MLLSLPKIISFIPSAQDVWANLKIERSYFGPPFSRTVTLRDVAQGPRA